VEFAKPNRDGPLCKQGNPCGQGLLTLACLQDLRSVNTSAWWSVDRTPLEVRYLTGTLSAIL
jgi:hypothetical protein